MKSRSRIRVKRIYEEAEKRDGVRVLVDRLWPRGVSKEKAHIDSWMKEITPSTKLRQWFHGDPTKRWEEFSERYEAELTTHRKELDMLKNLVKGKNLTLVTAVKEIEHSHIPVLFNSITRGM